MKDDSATQKDTKQDASLVPKRSYLFWANVFVLLPFAILVMRAVSTGSGMFVFWAFTIAPAALVTLGLDVYTLLQKRRTER